MKKFSVLICLLVLSVFCLFVCVACEKVDNDKPKSRVGIYDSRAVAYAYWWNNDRINEYHKPLVEQAKKAKEAGDQKRFKELDAELKAHQKLLHRQVFSTASIDNILEHIKGELSKVAQDANVVAVISKWDKKARRQYKSAEFIDVTDRIVEQFNLDEKRLKTAKEFKNHKPVPLWQLKIMKK